MKVTLNSEQAVTALLALTVALQGEDRAGDRKALLEARNALREQLNEPDWSHHWNGNICDLCKAPKNSIQGMRVRCPFGDSYRRELHTTNGR